MKKIIIESYRNKVNRPLSFFINWFGLTLGFAVVIVMYLYIIGEIRHDRDVYQRSMSNVFRCEIEREMGAIVPSPLAGFIAKMPEVAAVSKVSIRSGQTISTIGLATNNKFKISIMLVDSSMFNILPFKTIAGNSTNALSNADKVLLSRSTAIKLYGTTDVIGLPLELNNEHSLQISGIIEDVPENSTWSPEIICNIKLLGKLFGTNPETMFDSWGHWNYECYLSLNPGVDPVAFEAKYTKMVKDRLTEEWGDEVTIAPRLRAFEDIYFSEGSGYSSAKATNPNSLRILGLIATLILVIALINYVNIYTARSTEVIHAMGIKAILGCKRSKLILFVIFDSILITLISAISGMLLAKGLQPLYPSIIGSQVSFDMSLDTILVLFVGVPVVCGVLSGIFPALALTGMRPLEAIKYRGGGGAKMIIIRNVLIVFQFTITIGLIASTLFINKQMRYMNTLDLGYNRDNVYVVQGGSFMQPKFESFRSLLMSNPNISIVSIMKTNPIYVGEMTTMNWGDSEAESMTVRIMWNDENALALMGVQMVEGDSISPTNKGTLGYRQVMINETFAKKIRETNPEITFPFKNYIGVFKDFQFLSLYSDIGPLAIGSSANESSGSAFIRINAGSDVAAALKFIEKSFYEIYPKEIFEGSFMDEMFNNMYKKEQLFRSRLITFSILAIFIGCLGLFALVGYSVQRRRREIAIRKVYGATVGQVLLLLSIGFLKWLLISFVIAVPLVWILMNEWVKQFAYRADISLWIFAAAAVVAFLVAIITVLGQTYHCATENPANAVKY